MAIYEHIKEFAGKRIVDWESEKAIRGGAGIAYRISLDLDERDEGGIWVEKFEEFLDSPSAERVTGIVVGPWEQDYERKEEIAEEIVEALADAQERLPNLDAIFLG